MFPAVLTRLLRTVVDVRKEESITLLLMFLYSFLAMTSYNIVKPLATARFINDLGADNVPYVMLVAAFVIGWVMQLYTSLIRRLPSRSIIQITQAGMAAILLTFYVLFQAGQEWASAGLFFYRLILGILLISQFWTLANDIYDPRQAKRLFGFIGGGASLGGLTASVIVQQTVEQVGTNTLVLVSAILLAGCIVLVSTVLRRTRHVGLESIATAGEERGVGGQEALRMLRESKHLQLISLVIGFAALAAFVIENQLNLAAEAFAGQDATDRISQILATVQLYTSGLGFLIQIWLTSRIHRYLGIGFALLILPVSLGATAVIILLNSAIWAPALARVLDTSLRYTVDKTTREVLFLPLPTDLKYRAKPFVDVTIDRMAKGLGGVLVLVLIKPWGLNLGWQELSYCSLVITGLWIYGAVAARRGYLNAFRQSIERQQVAPADVRSTVADLSTIETLIEELASPEEDRVLYAIDVLESLSKRNLVTPLLLYHASPRVRRRALEALGSADSDLADRWRPAIERMMSDEDHGVRAAAVGALANLRHEDAADLVRPFLADEDPRMAATAAVVLANRGRPEDLEAADAAFTRLVADSSPAAAGSRRAAAFALGEIGDLRFSPLVRGLVYDADPGVAEEAIRSLGRLHEPDLLAVPALISLLGDRRLKSAARRVLVAYGESVVEPLAHFLEDENEDLWVRRHIPATLARIGTPRSLDVLVAALSRTQDGFLRFKMAEAIGRIRRDHPDYKLDREPIEKQILRDTAKYFEHLSLRANLRRDGKLPPESLLARTLDDKISRALNRTYLLLSVIYAAADIAAARWAIERGDRKMRSSAIEYLDNLLSGEVHKRVIAMVDELSDEERVRRGNVFLRTRSRDAEETLLRLINDDDQVVSAAAMALVADLGQWDLVDDIEHVLAHRDPSDWYVFEAASWTLAAHRLPDGRRRDLWREPLPAVEIATRLRHIPMYATLSIDELFRLASTGRQIRYERGRVLYRAGTTPTAVEYLLDGRVELTDMHGSTRTVEPPAPLAHEEMLDGVPLAETARAVERSVCLVLTFEQVRVLLADNTDLLQWMLRHVIGRDSFAAQRRVIRAATPVSLPPSGTDLSAVHRSLLLRQVPILSSLPATELLNLVAITTEVRVDSGAPLAAEGEPAALFVILEGRARVTGDADAPPAGPRDAIGLLEMLAGLPVAVPATAIEPLRALRVSAEDVFDLLSHRPLLLGALLAALFGRPAAPEDEAAAEPPLAPAARPI